MLMSDRIEAFLEESPKCWFTCKQITHAFKEEGWSSGSVSQALQYLHAVGRCTKEPGRGRPAFWRAWQGGRNSHNGVIDKTS